MKWVKHISNLFRIRQPTEVSFSLQLLREAEEWEKVAKNYDLSDLYMAGQASGRAQMLRHWSEHERKRLNEVI